MASTVPQPVLGATGYTLPAESDILSAVQNDLDTAFGTSLDRGLTTPQGQIATSLSAITANKNDLFAYYVSQVDPLYSQGRMQDAIGRIYFMDRIPARSTLVTCTCTGLPGTVIPAGTIAAKDASGNLYYMVSGTGATGIPPSGTVDLDVANQQTGNIACAAHALNKIYSAIPGWSSIDNAYAASGDALGRDVESQQEFEIRRQNSVALNSHSQTSSVYAAVAASVPSPLDVYVNENRSSATLTIGTVNLAPHSIYVAALGGSPSSITQAIFNKVSSGCAFNGNTTGTIIDSSYSYPQPQYVVKYQQPAAYQINVQVTLKNSTAIPASINALVESAIQAAFAGLDGGVMARIGSTTYASRFYSPVSAIGAYIQIIEITVSTDSLPTPVTSLTCEIDHYPTMGTVTVSLV